MLNKVLWSAVALLAAACAAEAYYIHARPRPELRRTEELLALEDRWLEETRRQLSGAGSLFEPPSRRFFDDRAFAGWFSEAPDVPGPRTEVRTTEDEVIVSFAAPGMRDGSVRVAVEKGRIRFEYEARSSEGDSAARGESVTRSVEELPIPTGADPARSRIVQEGGAVKVVFARLKGPHAHAGA